MQRIQTINQKITTTILATFEIKMIVKTVLSKRVHRKNGVNNRTKISAVFVSKQKLLVFFSLIFTSRKCIQLYM